MHLVMSHTEEFIWPLGLSGVAYKNGSVLEVHSQCAISLNRVSQV
jgi:hypothetical protein